MLTTKSINLANTSEVNTDHGTAGKRKKRNRQKKTQKQQQQQKHLSRKQLWLFTIKVYVDNKEHLAWR